MSRRCWGEKDRLSPKLCLGSSCQPCVGMCPHCPVTYLFSRTMSGSQTMVEGTRSSWVSSYSLGSQLRR